jgi:hypothetical protein
MTTPSFYAIIPAHVRYSKDLEPNAKLLYGEITALCSVEGYCWASNDYFAELFDVEDRTITNWLKSLKDNGFIFVETKTEGLQRERKIWVSLEIKNMFTKGKKFPDVRKKISQRMEKNFLCINKDSNTSITTEEKESSLRSDDPIHISKDRLIEAQDTANYFYQKVKSVHPTLKEPNMEAWTSVIEKTHRIDKRPYKEMQELIDWCIDVSDFWVKVLQSPEGLRKHYSKIIAQMRPPETKETQGNKNRDCAKKVFNYLKSIGDSKRMGLNKFDVYSYEKNETLRYDMNPFEFEKIIMDWFGLTKE